MKNCIKKDDFFFMQRAFDLAYRAQAWNEVPIGAVLVRSGQIIGEGWNQPIATHDPTAHAEIIAIRAAGQKMNNYRLPDTVLYTTLEPCPMCAGAIIQARIQRVIFAAFDPKSGSGGSVLNLFNLDALNHRVKIIGGLYAQHSAHLLRQFFRKRR